MMTKRSTYRAGTALVYLGLAACSSATQGVQGPMVPGMTVTQDGVPVAIVRYPHTPADARFMQGMIHHHAQAVVMAGWCPTHGASASVQRLCERIVVAQQDEIALMETWLHDRGEAIPDVQPHAHAMPGMDHGLMPGMLSAEQMTQLDAARGTEFDRLFLTFMIQHHEGAVTMVEELFASPGAAQDDMTYELASDVFADQTTEIERMQLMLDALSGGGRF
jgi:uncharacterized protein (DUF305 family)